MTDDNPSPDAIERDPEWYDLVEQRSRYRVDSNAGARL